MLPKERLGLNTTSNDAVARKSEHRIGQELYETLNRKRMQEKNLAAIKMQYDGDRSNGMERCQMEYKYLKAEATFIKTSYELAKLEYEKEKLIVRRNENNGRSGNTRKMQQAEVKRDRLKKEKEIAGITLINKQADCWELDAQAKLDKEIQRGEAAFFRNRLACPAWRPKHRRTVVLATNHLPRELCISNHYFNVATILGVSTEWRKTQRSVLTGSTLGFV